MRATVTTCANLASSAASSCAPYAAPALELGLFFAAAAAVAYGAVGLR